MNLHTASSWHDKCIRHVRGKQQAACCRHVCRWLVQPLEFPFNASQGRCTKQSVDIHARKTTSAQCTVVTNLYVSRFLNQRNSLRRIARRMVRISWYPSRQSGWLACERGPTMATSFMHKLRAPIQHGSATANHLHLPLIIHTPRPPGTVAAHAYGLCSCAQHTTAAAAAAASRTTHCAAIASDQQSYRSDAGSQDLPTAAYGQVSVSLLNLPEF